MLNLFKIVSVDMDGYLGRQYHPEETDVGLTVTPVKIDVTFFDEETGAVDNVFFEDGTVLADALPLLTGKEIESDGRYLETCYTCVTEDGRILELMDFEIEAV